MFEVGLDTTSPGTVSGTLSIPNNDSDENPFLISLTGTIELMGALIIDNDDLVGYSDSGNLGLWTNQGFQGDVRESVSGGVVETATYTFDGLPPGDSFEVAATWTAFLNRTRNARYAVSGVTNGDTVEVDQTIAPDDFMASGTWWESLGLFTVDEDGQLVVTLSRTSNGNVIADAVRIERAGRLVTESTGTNSGPAPTAGCWNGNSATTHRSHRSRHSTVTLTTQAATSSTDSTRIAHRSSRWTRRKTLRPSTTCSRSSAMQGPMPKPTR